MTSAWSRELKRIEELPALLEAWRKSCTTERDRREGAAHLVEMFGEDRLTDIAKGTGLSARTIRKGVREIQENRQPWDSRQRRPGGGRKTIAEKHPELIAALSNMMEPPAIAGREPALRWTRRGARSLTTELNNRGYTISHTIVTKLLSKEGYRMRINRPTDELCRHPDPIAQLAYVNQRVQSYQQSGQPAVFVEAEKSSITRRLAPFAVESVAAWWELGELNRYFSTRLLRLLIAADCGKRIGDWHRGLQVLADARSAEIEVCNIPAATYKWTTVGAVVDCEVPPHWQRKPLESRRIVITEIGESLAAIGRSAQVRLSHQCREGVRMPRETWHRINIVRCEFFGDWNYVIKPRDSARAPS